MKLRIGPDGASPIRTTLFVDAAVLFIEACRRPRHALGHRALERWRHGPRCQTGRGGCSSAPTPRRSPAGFDNTVRLWDATTRRHLRRLTATPARSPRSHSAPTARRSPVVGSARTWKAPERSRDREAVGRAWVAIILAAELDEPLLSAANQAGVDADRTARWPLDAAAATMAFHVESWSQKRRCAVTRMISDLRRSTTARFPTARA